tara:strand:- start:2182 stop:3834 length:1653 start_codon:yes stop_codon:yes gene_type:complete
MLFLKNLTYQLLWLFAFIPSVFADQYPFNYQIDIQHYAFELTLSDDTDELIGTAAIEILFKSNDVGQFRLDLANKTEERLGKGMEVSSIVSEGTQLKYRHQGDALVIKMNQPVGKGSLRTFIIEYRGIPQAGLEIKNNHNGDRTFFCESWPNNTRHWLPTIDHPYEKATVEFKIIAPAKYKVVSNGLLIEESVLEGGNKLTHWKQSVPVSCWLYVLGVAEFAVQQVGSFEGKPIQSWVYAKDRVAGFHDFARPTKNVLEFFSLYVGPFAYEKLANIQSSSIANGAMETASAILYAENLITGETTERLRNVVIHEIAHQWFGNSVTESTWDDAWLSEGFATYFTMLFQSHQYGHETYIKELKAAKKLIKGYHAKDSSFNVIDDRTAELGPVVTGMTYKKGAWFLHMLREKMGHEKFKMGIQSYYKKYFNGHASTADFIHEMGLFTSDNLTPFLHQWLKRPDMLEITVDWSYDESLDQINLILTQKASSEVLFDVPVEFEVHFANDMDPVLFQAEISAREATFKIPALMKPQLILADPRTVLLADIQVVEQK